MAVNVNAEYLIDDYIDLRKRNRMTQDAVAKRAKLHQAAIGRIENKSVTPQIDTMIKLLNTMGYTLAIVPSVGSYPKPIFVEIMKQMDTLSDANIKRIEEYVKKVAEEDVKERQEALKELMMLGKGIKLDPGESGTYKEIYLEELDRKYGRL